MGASYIKRFRQCRIDPAARAANLTRQLLTFSRRQVMQSQALDLNEIVISLAKMLQRILGDDVSLQLTLHPQRLVASVDAGMLDQVLLNLVVNARDAMPHGGRLVSETGDGADLAGRELETSGRPDFIHKPFSPRHLFEIVERCLPR